MFLRLLLVLAPASATLQSANPIRKVVMLMQNMQKEVEGEGKKEKELYDKFMCFCEATGAETAKAATDATAKIDELSSKIKEEGATKTQLEQEIGDHKKDREAAKNDLAEATNLRDKEKKEYEALAADANTNVEALASAIPAIEKGMGGAAFIQLPIGRRIASLVQSFPDIDPQDREDLQSFFQGSSSDASNDFAEGPASGQILGIMKQMKETMEANLKDADEKEAQAAASFKELSGSKAKEVEIASESIESKTVRTGELAVSLAQAKNDLEDTETELDDTNKYAEQLKEQCAAKEKAYAKAAAESNAEIAAISEAIGILNDDDALDVFKKAVPSASMMQQGQAFLQRSAHRASPARRAQAVLEDIATKHSTPQMHLMLYSLGSKIKLAHKGKVQKFEEIIKMVDGMVELLGKEQAEDDKHKEFCQAENEKAADEETARTTKVGSVTSALEEQEDAIAAVTEEIKVLTDGIAALDKAVVEATEQRKEEHAEYSEAQQMSEAALQLLDKAKKRLAKFYSPALLQYKDQPSLDQFENGAPSFVQVHAHARARADAEMWDSDNDAQETTARKEAPGVIGLMESIIHDIQGEMKDAENNEKSATSNYMSLMDKSQASRTGDVKSVTDKEAAKAEMEDKIVSIKEDLASAETELMNTKAYIADLNADCTFIMENYDLRKEARANERDGLMNAKAMLSGAKM
jgi:outer membrane murein-binding lipoprotein Lpp